MQADGYHIAERGDRKVLTDFWPGRGADNMQKLKQLALWLEREYPAAAESLREGLAGLLRS